MSQHCFKLAVVGCGAVTELKHLPVLANRADVQLVALVDADRSRAEQLAAAYGVPKVLTDYRELMDGSIDVCINALPNFLHAPVTVDLLSTGIHVLVEKPMALSAAECDDMLRAAEKGGATMAVGFMRRFLYSSRFAKSAIENGYLGRIVSFDVREGFIFNWPLASDFFFRKEKSGGGVLMDSGVHAVDQILWLLGDARSHEYYDDSFGGVEADCELHLVLESGARGTVELSRTRTLRNTMIIRGERGELEIGSWSNKISFKIPGEHVRLQGQGIPLGMDTVNQSQTELMVAEHDEWLDAIRNRRSSVISGNEGRRSVALIESCYKGRQPLELPWNKPSARESSKEAR